MGAAVAIAQVEVRDAGLASDDRPLARSVTFETEVLVSDAG